MRRLATVLLVGAMITGTAFAGVTGVAAAPIAAAAPVGKALTAASGGDLVQQVRGRHRHRHRHSHGGAIALGAAGLFLGLSALAAREHYYDPYSYDGPIRYSYEPWSPAWFDDCSDRFRTFNPGTGYYKGYDGEYHFCR